MIVLGCDVGNVFTKAVVLDNDKLVASRVQRTTGNVVDEIGALLTGVIADAGLTREQVDRTVSTGAGAGMVPRADYTEDEVNCAAAAAAFFDADVDLAIHAGGQSIASMLLNADGEVVDFLRNDKCASGSGRFLEMMVRKLDVPIDGVDAAAAAAAAPVVLSSQCGVFAESEIISHLNDGVAAPDIVAGICGAVGGFVVAQGRRFKTATTYTVTGGVARFSSVLDVIRARLAGAYRPFPHDPMLAAAIGAAILGGGDEDE